MTPSCVVGCVGIGVTSRGDMIGSRSVTHTVLKSNRSRPQTEVSNKSAVILVAGDNLCCCTTGGPTEKRNEKGCVHAAPPDLTVCVS